MATQEAPINDFGLLIAYVLPGFTALWGVSYFSPELRSWIGQAPDASPTLGGFLYMTVAAIAAGLTVSTVRWLLIDPLHHATGVRKPTWDFSRFQENVAAYNVLNEIHYKYYQFYGNGLVALIFVYMARRIRAGFLAAPFGWFDLGFLLLVVILFLGSRDTLKKFYARTGQVLADSRKRHTRRGESVPVNSA